MADLMSTDAGRAILRRIACFIGRDRMSSHMQRSFFRAFDAWNTAEQLTPGSGYFNLATLLDTLNSTTQDEISNLDALLARLGCIEGTTFANTSVYIDPTSGSDTTGDGSSAHPYASLAPLLSGGMPKTINHVYNLVFLSSYVHSGNLIFDVDFGPNGSLNLIGVGAPTVVAGPFEILSTSALDDGLGRFFQGTGAIGADPSGNFALVTDGNDAGYAQAIHSLAAADTILTVNGSFLNVAMGNHFSVVRPPVSITCDQISFQCRNTNGYTSLSKLGAKVSCFNLRFVISDLAANSKVDCVLIDNACAQQMSFCQIVAPTDGTMRVTQRADLNTLNAPAGVSDIAASTVTNFVDYAQYPDFAGLVVDQSVGSLSIVAEGYVKLCSTRSPIFMRKTAVVEDSTASRIQAEECTGRVLSCLAEGRANSGAGGGLEVIASNLDVEGFSALNSDNVISVLNNSKLTVEKSGADSTYSTVSGFGVYCAGVAQVELRDASARLIGATSPYGVKLATVASPVTSAIPAAWGWTNDATGTFVKRLGV